MFKKYTNIIEIILLYIFSNKQLENMQDKLITAGILINIYELSAKMILISLILLVLSLLSHIILNISEILLLVTIIPEVVMVNYVLYKIEKQQDSIDEDLPDYLLQLSSLLNVGVGLESAFIELSQTTDSYLNDEIKRALIEIKLGKSFNDAFLEITDRCDSNNLKQAIQVIVNTKESGGNLSEILIKLSEDFKDLLMLKKERKTSVMMSVMFLLISTIIATPFSFGTIGVYSQFLESVGRRNYLSDVIPISSLGYMIIHSILVSILISIVMYSDYKKSLKYICSITPLSLAVYYISQIIIKSILL